MTLLLRCTVLVLWALCVRPALALPQDPAPLTIATAAGTLALHVEIADTPHTREQGLMFRTALPDDGGMLFLFETAQPIVMWMKNTSLPLDMLFIDDKGVISGIAARTTPFSEAFIRSPGPALAVLEIGGGNAERLGIAPGDRIRHPRFRPLKEP